MLAHKGLVVHTLRGSRAEVVLSKGTLALSCLLQPQSKQQVPHYTHTHRHTQTDTHTHTDRHTDTHTDRHTDTHTDRHTDTHTDRHTDTHTDRHTDTSKSKSGSGVQCHASPSHSACSGTRWGAPCPLLCSQHGPRLQFSGLTENRCRGGEGEAGRQGRCSAHQRRCCCALRRECCSPAHCPSLSLCALAERQDSPAIQTDLRRGRGG